MRSISAKVTADVSVLKRAMESGGQYVKGFGRNVKETSREASADLALIDATAAKLRDQMQSTAKAVDDLGLAFAKTGDATLLKQRDQQQKLLADLKKAHALVFDTRRSQDDGGKAGRAYATALKDAVSSAGDIFASTAMNLGKLIPPEVKVALVAGALAAAPIVGAALGGAVSGAAGGLGIAGGFALALRDPRIKAAAGSIGADILAELTSNAGMFGSELLNSLDVFRNQIKSLDGDFESIFANSANFVAPLTDSVSTALGDVVQGIDEVVAQAGPSMDALGAGIEMIGGATGDFLSMVASNGDTGAKALTDLFTAAQLAIQQVTMLVDLFSKIYELNDAIGGFGLFGILSDLNGATSDFGFASHTAGEGADELKGNLAGVAAAATTVQHEFESMADAVNKSIDVNLTAAEAALRLRQATADAARAADRKKGVSVEEEQALLSLARASNAATEAADANGRTSDQAAAAYGRQRRSLIAAAVAMGYSSGAAARLADQLLAIPKNTKPKVSLAVSGQGQLNAIRQAIAQLPNRKDVQIAIRVTGSTSVGGVRSALDKQSANAYQRHGGVMTAMAAGGTLDAGIYPASSPPLVKFAEPETGGELYLPRRGDRARGRQLVAEAASWYGMTAMARGGIHAPGEIAMAAGGYVNVAPGGGSTRTGTKLDTASAILSARDAVAALNKSLKENGRSFSLSTAKGRENRSALISGIKAAQDAARAKFEETGSVKAANAVYDQYIAKLKATVKGQKASAALLKDLAKRPVYDTPAAAPKNSSGNVAYVQSKSALVEATEAASSFFDRSWGKPTFITGTASGRDNLNALFEYLAAAEASAQAQFKQTGSAKLATSTYNASLKTLRGILTATGMSKKEIDNLLSSFAKITLGNRYGGVYEHAQQGLLRDAHIASGGPTRYAYAEPATGGELFAPRNGNLAKTRKEVGWAVQNWWGGQVAWQAGPGSRPAGGAAGAMTIRVVVQDGAVAGLVRVEVDEQLGALADASVYATNG